MNTITRPIIVCLCGSTKFKDEFITANEQETLKGKIVLSVGLFGHADNRFITNEEKKGLDELHFEKIKIADEILVIDVNSYIGISTRNEIHYARALSKHIRFWSKEKPNA